MAATERQCIRRYTGRLKWLMDACANGNKRRRPRRRPAHCAQKAHTLSENSAGLRAGLEGINGRWRWISTRFYSVVTLIKRPSVGTLYNVYTRLRIATFPSIVQTRTHINVRANTMTKSMLTFLPFWGPRGH